MFVFLLSHSSMYQTSLEDILKRRLSVQALLQTLQGMNKILHEACGPLPDIDQRMSAVSSLLNGSDTLEVSSKPPSPGYGQTPHYSIISDLFQLQNQPIRLGRYTIQLYIALAYSYVSPWLLHTQVDCVVTFPTSK